MPAQSSRSIGFLMLVGSSLTLCGLICNNNAMLSPSLLRYYPSKSNFRLLVTIVVSVLFARSSNESFKGSGSGQRARESASLVRRAQKGTSGATNKPPAN